jgi:hypothetical protein
METKERRVRPRVGTRETRRREPGLEEANLVKELLISIRR